MHLKYFPQNLINTFLVAYETYEHMHTCTHTRVCNKRCHIWNEYVTNDRRPKLTYY